MKYKLNYVGLVICGILLTLQGNTQTIVKLPHNILESYMGLYNVSANFSLTFVKDAEYLILNIPGQPSIAFFPESQTKFFIKEKSGITVEFNKNAEGVVDKVLLIQDGQRLIATKLTSESFNPDKQYTIKQLSEDFNFLRSTLEKNHPRLYEFTPKSSFDQCFDSLYSAIRPMNEIEFRYFLLPIIAKVHCGHTSLEQSVQYAQQNLLFLPPFVLYYEGKRAFIRLSADSVLLPGTEVLEINGTPVATRIFNFLSRVSADGIHSSVQYYMMNQPISSFNYEIPEWFNVKNYKLLIVNKDGKNSEVNLKALGMPEFVKFNPPPPPIKNQLNITADHSSAVLTYPSFDFPNDSIRNSFLNSTFLELRNKRVNSLIIDLRGNGGGNPLNAAYFLRYLMDRDFVYSTTSSISEYLKLTGITYIDENRYRGNMYFLIDGGSFSSTGHLLSFVKKYNLGTLIGELSSGSYSCNTKGFPFHLPNSKLILKCPTGIYETSVKGQDRAKGIVPDYEVRNSLTDILSGQDKVLAFVQALAAERK